MSDSSLDFSPVELVQEELASKHRESRIRAVRGFRAVAKALGQEKTRQKLIVEILLGFVQEEAEDEVLFELAKLLGTFDAEIGGAAHIHLLFEPLGLLAGVEETTVRAQAARSLNELMSKVDTTSSSDLALGLVADMQTRDGFGAKVSAAALVAGCCRMMKRCGQVADSPGSTQARGVLKALLQDESPMVRRAAARELSSFAAALDTPETFAVEFAGLVATLLKDQHDLVRLVAVEELGIILGSSAAAGARWAQEAAVIASIEVRAEAEAAEAAAAAAEGGEDGAGAAAAPLPPAVKTRTTALTPALSAVRAAHGDPSWRVREALARGLVGYARHCAEGCGAAESTAAELEDLGELISILADLLADHELEVRIAAFASAAGVCEAHKLAFAQNEDVLAALVGASGAEAPEQKCRIAAATALTRLVAHLDPGDGDDEAILRAAQRRIFTAIEKTFLDEHVEVMLATLRELGNVIPHLDADSAMRVSQIVQNTTHDNWRVRCALTLAMPALAAKRGRDAFESDLLDGLLRSFQDSICQVRMAGVTALGMLRELRDAEGNELFSGDWLMDKIAKRLSELYLTISYYLYRITIVQAFEKLMSSTLPQAHMDTVVMFLVDAARDDVPNVKFTAVRALTTACKFANDQLVANCIKPTFNELAANDTDIDVATFVKDALGTI